MHSTTYEYLTPTMTQISIMNDLRQAAKAYGDVLEQTLPEGPDKTYIIRRHRETAMWVNVCVTRNADGSPRAE
jgi:hypothetical protein